MDEEVDFNRIKKRSFSQLTFQEKMEMAGDVFIDRMPRDDIARKYCVQERLISTLVTRLNSNKKFLEELINRHYTKEDKTQKI